MSLFITHSSVLHSVRARPLEIQIGKNLKTLPAFRLSPEHQARVDSLFRDQNGFPAGFEKIDRVTKLALTTSKGIVDGCERGTILRDLVVIAASARGTTATSEEAISEFNSTGKVSALTSPLTTAGGIASAVSHFVCPESIGISTSMTCASFFEALLIAKGLLQSKMFLRALIVGAEAPLTPYTIAQMLALKIYSTDLESQYPCKPFNSITENRNQMVLGEGAGAFLIETEESLALSKNCPIAELTSLGFCQEHDETLTGMNREGEGFVISMRKALENHSSPPSLILAHAPGTIRGDLAERNALEKVFPSMPPVISTKYFTGHTFGASGALSLQVALDYVTDGCDIDVPFDGFMKESGTAFSNSNRSVLINSAGFGGIVFSALIKKI